MKDIALAGAASFVTTSSRCEDAPPRQRTAMSSNSRDGTLN